ncbi:sensor histidine kinase [Ferrimonas marina]|uniref:histidine kinase n=1 Tax=Ferrimonas marina TaxID=299255 RepID=A0A1M5RQV6_9GAMM|nr:HAMP domain-containing sensor histidine kinase [Ferrimonas marina]SHH28570.1 Signal transduction histidine kinase [Ferrimonas marina]
MSLKRYLFFAFGSLLLLFTAMQLILVQLLGRDLHATLADQSSLVARHVAEVTVEHLFEDEQRRLVLMAPSPEQVERLQQQAERLQQQALPKEAQAELQAQAEAIAEEALRWQQHWGSDTWLPHLSDEEREQVQRELEAARTEALAQARAIQIEFGEGSVAIQGFDTKQHQLALPQSPEQQLLQQFNHTLLWSLLALGLVGLGLIYLLAQRLSQPLEALDRGCQQLAAGDLGHTLNPRGSREVRNTMEAFNQMSRALAQMTEQQRQMQSRAHLAEIGEIARGLAHALRNPLHTIGLTLDQVAKAEGDSPWQEQIRRKLQHMDKSLTALLTLSTQGIDRNETHKARALVDDIILELSMTNPRRIRFANQLSQQLSLTGAHTELRTLLHVLIVNALEASPDGGEVRIHSQPHPQGTRLVVDDDGPGLDPSLAERLFQPHQTSKAEGSGMGLYLARRLARLWYQGEVTLENRPGNEGIEGARASLILGQGEQ